MQAPFTSALSQPPSLAALAAGPRVHLVTFGCQMNKYDSGMIAGLLAARGAVLVEDDAGADVVVLNTCAVRGHAEDRVFSRLGLLGRLKRRRPGLLIAVVGCMAQRSGAQIAERFPHVDVIAGTRVLDELPRLIERVRDGAPTPLTVTETGREPDFGSVVARRPARALAYLTVMRGCDKHCAYCVVPATRGPERSRPIPAVVAEAERLIADGAVELTLLGQTIDTYGRDLPPSPPADLPRLLRALHRLPGLGRLRFVTSHPAECREELWRTIHELGDKVMPFIHMPAQSGSDRILARMNRGYTRAQYLAVVAAARRLCPEIELASDWIVGFSGETDEDFAQTVSLVEEVRFHSGFVFKYSVRDGTPAEQWPDDVPRAVKEERHQRLSAVQARIALEENRARVGQVETVLVEGPSKTDASRLTGRSRTFRLVHFPGSPDLIGKLVQVRVTSATALSLQGERV